MRALRVLFINNDGAGRCGIRLFGDNMKKALRDAGVDLTAWNGSYEALYEKPYLPANVSEYDIVHLSWHPIASNHWGPGHFSEARNLSVYLNDIPPWSGCPVEDRADVLFAAEPYGRCVVIPYPTPDFVAPEWTPPPRPLIGFSGVRKDGHDVVREVCARRGWDVNEPTLEWTPIEEEMTRLARSTVNCAFYHEGRGISGGVAILIGAQRPVVTSASPMFSHLAEADDVYRGEDLEALLVQAVEEQTRPLETYERLRWSVNAPKVIAAWEAVLR